MESWVKRFQRALDEVFSEALQRGDRYVVIKAGDLHRRVGGYPGPNHRMPICCHVMRKNMQPGDEVLQEPRSGIGASLTIRYSLLRNQRMGTLLPEPVAEESYTIGGNESSRFEEIARKYMSMHFGVPLSKRTVLNIPKSFDMVSPDYRIIGDAKYFTMVRGKSIPPAKFSVIAEHVWLLEKTSAEHKFLVFGKDRRVPLEWLKRYGHLVEDVEFYFLDERNQRLEKLN